MMYPSLLKEEAGTAIKDVLTGVHGSALPCALSWLRLIEQFIPDLLPICYETLRTYCYVILLIPAFINQRELLELRDMMAMLPQSDIVVQNELNIFNYVDKWAKGKNLSKQTATKELKPLLDLIRFHNIDADGLQMVENSYVCTLIGKSKFLNDYVYPAYKVHSQMVRIVSPGHAGGRVKKSSTGKCPLECPYVTGEDCPHLNPRLYISRPYGNGVKGKVSTLKCCKVNISVVMVVDTSNVKQYATLQLGLEDHSIQMWTLKYDGVSAFSETHVNEIFTLTHRTSIHCCHHCAPNYR